MLLQFFASLFLCFVADGGGEILMEKEDIEGAEKRLFRPSPHFLPPPRHERLTVSAILLVTLSRSFPSFLH